MAEVVTRETSYVQGYGPNRTVAQSASAVARREPHETVGYLVYFLLGLVETLLIFRFIFRIMGANPGAGFVSLIYGLTAPLIAPFEGIFGRVAAPGVETTAVVEPSTLVAMLVYAFVAWAINYLVRLMSGRP